MIAQSIQNDAIVLPLLREDLSVYRAPASRSGSPNWSIFDPVRNVFFNVDWVTFEILMRWHLKFPEKVVQEINQETTLRIDIQQVIAVIEFLNSHDLVVRNTQEHTKQLSIRYVQQKKHWLNWLLHQYLFFRIPLLHPNDWLGGMVDKVKWLGSRTFFSLTILVLFLGLFLVSRQWDSFTSSLVDMFSIEGLIFYGITLILIKFFHELGHAFTAKNFGCRVPTMGIAFLVLFPLAYTDVNDVWRLSKKNQRLWISAAGILTELYVAVWSTLLWALCPDGVLKTGLFLLSTTTWISTLAINASPFLRFDGYFLLMDYLDIPNLHQRAFSLAKWKIRQLLFGLTDSVPEHFTKGLHRFLISFAWGVWIYRLIVFSGIAVLVYLMFPKPLGPILGAIELYWFILKPIVNEIKTWIERRSEVVSSMRARKTLFVLFLLLLMVSVPWDHRVSAPGVLHKSDTKVLTSPADAKVERMNVSNGDLVKKNTILMQLVSPELEYELQKARLELDILQNQYGHAELNIKQRELLPLLKSEIERAKSKIMSFQQRIEKLTIKADFDGIVRVVESDLKVNDWVSERQELINLINPEKSEIFAFVEQRDLERIAKGDTAVFIDNSGRLDTIQIRVINIDKDSTRILEEAVLGSVHGGDILVRQLDNQLIPERSIYRVIFEISSEQVLTTELPKLLGRVVIFGEERAWINDYLKSAMAVLHKELGF